MFSRGAVAVVLGLAIAVAGCDRGLSSEQKALLSKAVVDAPPAGMIEKKFELDGQVEIVGTLIEPKAAVYEAGSKVKLTIVWRPLREIARGWQIFTHLVGPGGELLANIDASGPMRALPNVEGAPLPPSEWKVGKYYLDTIEIEIPQTAPYQVRVGVGLYKGDKRMTVAEMNHDKLGRAIVAQLNTGAKRSISPIKELEVEKLASNGLITIDGKLDEAAWQSAPSTGPFVNVGSGREAPEAPTQGRARLLWDDEFLYVGFDVTDKHVHGGIAPGSVDPHLWEKETCEIMIDPDGDGDNKDYYEIQIGPQNMVFDSQFDDYNAPRGGENGPFGHQDWTAALTSAVVIHGTLDDDKDEDQGYTVEAKLPWRSFTKAKHAPPEPGSSWRMNFYAMKNNGGTAWSPILGMGNFHKAARFGRVKWRVAGAPAASTSASASPATSASPK